MICQSASLMACGVALPAGTISCRTDGWVTPLAIRTRMFLPMGKQTLLK